MASEHGEDMQETFYCMVPGCGYDLSQLSRYHQRHRVCHVHLKANKARLNGTDQRFCQQCGRFQPLSEFTEDRRSCKAALRAHNARRRHSSMASDNAAYQGRLPQTAGNKRSLLSTAAEGAGAAKASKRQLERVASFSRGSCNSAPALLQNTGTAHEGSRRLRSSSSDWASNSDDAWADEEQGDKGMSESPSASYGSAEQEELPKPKPRGRKAQQQQQQQQQSQQQSSQVQQQDHHQQIQMAFAQHGYNEWSNSCNPAMAQMDALHLLQKAAGSEVSSAGMLQAPAAAAKPTGQQDKVGKGRCRLGQPEMHSVGAAASKLHSNRGYAAAAGMLPKWQLAAGFSQMPQPGVQPGGLSAGWFSAAAAGPCQQQHYQQQQHSQQQAVMQELQSTGMSAAAAAWQAGPSTGGQAQQQQQHHHMVATTTQGFPAASIPAAWRGDFHAAARQQMLSPQASSLPTAWQGGFNPDGAQSAQQGGPGPSCTHGFPASSMPSNWQGKTPAVHSQRAVYRGSPCSESDFPPPQRTHSMPAAAQYPSLQRAALLSHNSADPTSIMQAARQAQLSPSGMTNWPVVCQGGMAPALPVRVKVQDMPAQTYWDQAPSPAAHMAPAAEQHLQGLSQYGARQALALAQHILGSHQHGAGVSGGNMHPQQHSPGQTYGAQGPPAAEMRGQQQQQGGDPDWLDVLTCTEGPETCESGYKPGAGTAGNAAAAASQTSPGVLANSSTTAGQGSAGFGAGAGAGRLSCISPEFNLLQSCLVDPDGADADLPSDEIDALLDQALEDLFTTQPRVVLSMCRAEGSNATFSDATAAAAGPCTSTARNEPL